jgi:hypothetical protein
MADLLAAELLAGSMPYQSSCVGKITLCEEKWKPFATALA